MNSYNDIGISFEGLCYYAIYRLISSESKKYAHVFRSGVFGGLMITMNKAGKVENHV